MNDHYVNNILFFHDVVEEFSLMGRNVLPLFLTWVLGDVVLFDIILEFFGFKKNINCTRDAFFRGYCHLKENLYWRFFFKPAMWNLIIYSIEHRLNYNMLPENLRRDIRLFKKNPNDFVDKALSVYNLRYKQLEAIWQYSNCLFDMGVFFCHNMEDIASIKYRKAILTLQKKKREKEILFPMWIQVPSDFYYLCKFSNCEVLVCAENNVVQPVVGRAIGKLNPKIRDFLRKYIIELYKSKWSVSRSDSRISLKESMRAIGPLINMREGKGNKYVSFYRNKIKFCSKKTKPKKKQGGNFLGFLDVLTNLLNLIC